MILGIGVDLCEVDRIEAAIGRHGQGRSPFPGMFNINATRNTTNNVLM